MIITAKASTIRAAAKRAGELGNLNIRTGLAATNAEFGLHAHDAVSYGECSVRIAVLSRGVNKFVDELAKKYGTRGNEKTHE